MARGNYTGCYKDNDPCLTDRRAKVSRSGVR